MVIDVSVIHSVVRGSIVSIVVSVCQHNGVGHRLLASFHTYRAQIRTIM